MKRVVDSGRKKVNQLHTVISNRDVDLNARTTVVYFYCL